jgi:hypothetical protein
MAWMLRWWQAILSTLQGNDRELRGWVEPSNAITRAILAAPRTLTTAVERPAAAEPEAAPDVRTRRRRSSRAA